MLVVPTTDIVSLPLGLGVASRSETPDRTPYPTYVVGSPVVVLKSYCRAWRLPVVTVGPYHSAFVREYSPVAGVAVVVFPVSADTKPTRVFRVAGSG
jgi:hypothetical protein